MLQYLDLLSGNSKYLWIIYLLSILNNTYTYYLYVQHPSKTTTGAGFS